jgi:hypothetical protein
VVAKKPVPDSRRKVGMNRINFDGDKPFLISNLPQKVINHPGSIPFMDEKIEALEGQKIIEAAKKTGCLTIGPTPIPIKMELKGDIVTYFDWIKRTSGLEANTEVIRHAITMARRYYPR